MGAMDRAAEAIDQANAEDPTITGDGPLALVQGKRAVHWVHHLDNDPSEALLLAARAHHLRRWVVPRADYPDGRAGYLTWRRAQRERQSNELLELLATAQTDQETSERATVILAKTGLGTDPEVQTFEDAVCLTFLETQYRELIDKVDDDDKMVGVVAKTLQKMSTAGRRTALTIQLHDRGSEIVKRALSAMEH